MDKMKKFGQILIYLLVLFFILRIFYANWSVIRTSLDGLKLFYLFFSVVLFGFSFIILSFIWYQMIGGKNRIAFVKASFLYLKSHILRYIPGNIWGLGGRIYFFSKSGFEKSKLIVILIYESLLLVFSGVVAYFLFKKSLSMPTFFDLIIALIGFIFLVFLFFPRIYIYIYRLIFRKPLDNFDFPVLKTFIYFIQYLIYWLVCGLAVFFLVISITDYSGNKMFLLFAVYAISWVLGFLSLITPSGLGIREVSLSFMLAKFISLPLAGLISIFARLVFVIGEFLALGIMRLLNNGLKNKQIQ